MYYSATIPLNIKTTRGSIWADVFIENKTSQTLTKLFLINKGIRRPFVQETFSTEEIIAIDNRLEDLIKGR